MYEFKFIYITFSVNLERDNYTIMCNDSNAVETYERVLSSLSERQVIGKRYYPLSKKHYM